MLESWGPGIWTADSVMRVGVISQPTRMTVIRLADGSLFLHSPVPPTEELVNAVRACGEVAYLVSPNLFHHLSLGLWAELFPDARVIASPRLRDRVQDVTFHDDLTETPDPAWADVLDQTIVTGNRLVDEVVFLHTPSRTLIVADICFHFTKNLQRSFRR